MEKIIFSAPAPDLKKAIKAGIEVADEGRPVSFTFGVGNTSFGFTMRREEGEALLQKLGDQKSVNLAFTVEAEVAERLRERVPIPIETVGVSVADLKVESSAPVVTVASADTPAYQPLRRDTAPAPVTRVVREANPLVGIFIVGLALCAALLVAAFVDKRYECGWGIAPIWTKIERCCVPAAVAVGGSSIERQEQEEEVIEPASSSREDVMTLEEFKLMKVEEGDSLKTESSDSSDATDTTNASAAPEPDPDPNPDRISWH